MINILKRIVDNFNMEVSTLIYSIVLIDKLCNTNKLILDMNNIYSIFASSVFISYKMHEDYIYPIDYFSEIVGIKEKEIIIYESIFLDVINYKALIKNNDFNQYLQSFLY